MSLSPSSSRLRVILFALLLLLPIKSCSSSNSTNIGLPENWFLIVAAGDKHNTSELYDDVTGQWYLLPNLAYETSAMAFAFTAMDLPSGQRSLRLYLAGGAELTGTKRALYFDLFFNKWVELPQLGLLRACPGGALFHGRGAFVVCGGSPNRKDPNPSIFNSCESLNLVNEEESQEVWQPFPSLVVHRMSLKMLPYVGSLIAIGGIGVESHSISSCELYSNETQVWVSTVPMNQARDNFAAAIIFDKIYVAGGFVNDSFVSLKLSTIEIFDGYTWQYLSTSLATPRGSCYAAFFKNKLIILGGTNINIEIYDPTTGLWDRNALPYMNALFRGRSGFAAFSDPFYQAPYPPTRSSMDGYVAVLGGVGRRSLFISNSNCTLPWRTLPSFSVIRQERPIAAAIGHRIFLFGGGDGVNQTLSSGEYFDLYKNKWYPMPSMSVARSLAAAAASTDLLKIFVAGGESNEGVLSTCEMLDLTSYVWSPFRSLPNGTFGHSMVAYNGLLIVIGGYARINEPVSLCWQFDLLDLSNPVVEWSRFPPLIEARAKFGAAVVEGRIYVAGGWTGHSRLGSVEAFSPTSQAWQLVQAMPNVRSDFQMVPFPGKATLIGGISPRVDHFFPTSNAWGSTVPDGDLLFYDSATVSFLDSSYVIPHKVTDVPIEYIFVAGGIAKSTAEIYSSGSGWTNLPEMPHVLTSRPGVMFRNNKVYVAGGCYNDTLCYDAFMSFDLLSSRWDFSLPVMSTKRSNTAGVYVESEDYFVLIGGEVIASSGRVSTILSSCECYSFREGVWASFPSLYQKRRRHAAVLYQGNIVVLGGLLGVLLTNSTEIFQFDSGVWTSFLPFQYPRETMAAAVFNGFIYIAGGYNGTNRLSSVEYFDGSVWSVLSNHLPRARDSSNAVSFENRLVLLGGSDITIIAFDPQTLTWNESFPPMIEEFRSDAVALSFEATLTSLLPTYDYLAVLGGFGVTNGEIYSPLINEWVPLPNMTALRYSIPAAGAYGSRIVIAGGQSETFSLSSAEYFDLDLWSWIPMLDMNIERDQTASIMDSISSSSGGFAYLYVFGGSVGQSDLNSAERIQIDHDDLPKIAWEPFPSFSVARRMHSAVTYGKAADFVILGGFDGTLTFDSGEIFHHSVYLWSSFPSMKYPRAQFAAATVNGSIFAAGGTLDAMLTYGKRVSSVEAFNGIDWRELATGLASPRFQCSGSSFLNRFVVVGGGQNVEVYDPIIESWMESDIPAPLSLRIQSALVSFSTQVLFSSLKAYVPVSTRPSTTTASTISSQSSSAISTPSSISSSSSSTTLSSGNLIIIIVIGTVFGLSMITILFFYRRSQSRFKVSHALSLELQRIETLQIRSENLLRRSFPHIPYAAGDDSQPKGARSRGEVEGGLQVISKATLVLEREIGTGSSGSVSVGLYTPIAKKVDKSNSSKERARSFESNSMLPQSSHHEYTVSSDNHVKCAIKTLKLGGTIEEEIKFLCECKLLSVLRHAHIVRLIGVCLETNPIMMVMEYLPHGNLKDFLKSNNPTTNSTAAVPIGFDQLSSYIIQVCSALEFLETYKILHRDVAARNVLVAENYERVKLSDFGLSRWMESSDYYHQLSDDRVPLKWLPLESIEDKIFTSKSDVWGFGVLCWEIFSFGASPYHLMSNAEIVRYVKDGKRLQQPPACPHEWYQVLLSCWQTVARSRPSFHQLNSTIISLSKNHSNPSHSQFSSEANFQLNPLLVSQTQQHSSNNSLDSFRPSQHSTPRNSFSSNVANSSNKFIRMNPYTVDDENEEETML